MLVVRALYVKPGVGRPMRAVARASGVAGVGLVGDAGAAAASPRHVLVAATAALRELALPDEALRANVVVDGDLGDLVPGAVLDLGGMRLRVTLPCEPCRKLDRIRPGLAAAIGARRGVLARVVCGGDVAVGDVGRIAAARAPALAPRWRDRARAIVVAIPDGMVLSYAALALAAGVHPSYCRAMPGALREMARHGAPVERVVAARSEPGRAYWDASTYHASQERGLAVAHAAETDATPSGRDAADASA